MLLSDALAMNEGWENFVKILVVQIDKKRKKRTVISFACEIYRVPPEHQCVQEEVEKIEDWQIPKSESTSSTYDESLRPTLKIRGVS